MYCLVVTDTVTGCSAFDFMTVTVDQNDPGFSLNINTTNSSYMQLTATPNQTAGLPSGFGFMWFIDELDAGLNTVYSVTSSDPQLSTGCWWTFPGAEVFDGFNGLTHTVSLSCLPSPGQFKYNTYYRITRGVWSTKCPWKANSMIISNFR